jgi:hypothetical protein
VFHHVVAEYINSVCISVSLSSLTLLNMQSIKRARSVYALSCITSPGGKHRGLAGSVAVLIAESLLMLSSLYTLTVAQKLLSMACLSRKMDSAMARLQTWWMQHGIFIWHGYKVFPVQRSVSRVKYNHPCDRDSLY